MGYIQPADLLNATVQYLSAAGTQGVDFTLYTTDQLQSLIDRVSNQIDGYCKQSFALTNVQERYMGRGTNMLRLRRYPLAQIPDSVFGGAGNVSQSLVCNTIFTTPITSGQITAGIKAVVVADCSNMLPGQFLQWNDGTAELAIEIASVSATTGAGTVTLKSNLTVPHPIPPANTNYTASVVVNTIDFMQIVLPGQSVYPIPIQQLVVDSEKGMLINYTPLMFQNLGYATIFPNFLPLLTRYTYGFLAGQVPAVLQEVCIEQCRRTVLKLGNVGAGGVSRITMAEQTIAYTPWKPVPLDPDLADALGPFRRNVGFT